MGGERVINILDWIPTHPPPNLWVVFSHLVFAEPRHGAIRLGAELVGKRGREVASGDERLAEGGVVVVGYDFAVGVPVVPDAGGFYLTQSPRSPRRIFITQSRRGAEGVGGACMGAGDRAWRRGWEWSHQLSMLPTHDTIVADRLHHISFHAIQSVASVLFGQFV